MSRTNRRGKSRTHVCATLVHTRCKTSQNEYFNENWMSRGVPTVDVIGADPPPCADTDVAAGIWKDGWLNRLKKSVRNLRFWRSPSLKVLPSVKSTFFCGGPMMQLRGVLP